jgi:ornithine carbamoyltransferase
MTTAAPPATTPGGLLRVSDLEPGQLAYLLDLSARMKERPNEWRASLGGETLACYFEKPSTRTRISFEAAAYRLGMLPLYLRRDELQLGRGEPLGDTGRVLSSYVAAIAIRTFAQRTIEELAEAATVPVINALSDDHHPCQALADLLMLKEQYGSLAGLKVAFVGDGDSNVAHSLLEAGALTGVHVALAAPEGYLPRAAIVESAQLLAAESGGSVIADTDLVAAVRGADAVYTDVWASMCEEDERALRRRDLAPFQVTIELMDYAKPEAVFLHCLPTHRGEEVQAAVLEGRRSLVWQQAANRLPTEQALLYALISRTWETVPER